jgi:hypothetical protein
MLVKATKAMTDLLRKNLNLECIEMIKLCKFSESEFSRLVDYNSYNRICDYSLTTGKFSVIKIIYKSENYANPAYLTTKDLLRCFNRSDKSIDSFINAIADAVAI